MVNSSCLWGNLGGRCCEAELTDSIEQKEYDVGEACEVFPRSHRNFSLGAERVSPKTSVSMTATESEDAGLESVFDIDAVCWGVREADELSSKNDSKTKTHPSKRSSDIISNATVKSRKLGLFSRASEAEAESVGKRSGRPRFVSTDTISTAGRLKIKIFGLVQNFLGNRNRDPRRSWELFPALILPSNGALCEAHLPGTTVAAALASIMSEGDSVYRRFMEETLKCVDISCTPWSGKFGIVDGQQDLSNLGTLLMRMDYMLPTPGDIPDILKRLINLPDTIPGTTFTWLALDDDVQGFLVRQRSSSEGVLYSDRFHLDYHLSIRCHDGGILVREWMETVWSRRLPWTHAIVERIIESRARSDTVGMFGEFVRFLKEQCEAFQASGKL